MKAKLKTYLTNLENGLIKTKTDIVLRLIIENPDITIHDIRQMGITHQTATGVVSVLMDEGIVYITGSIQIRNRHYSTLKFETDELMRLVRAKHRLFDRYKNWLANMQEFEVIIGKHKIDELKAILSSK